MASFAPSRAALFFWVGWAKAVLKDVTNGCHRISYRPLGQGIIRTAQGEANKGNVNLRVDLGRKEFGQGLE